MGAAILLPVGFGKDRIDALSVVVGSATALESDVLQEFTLYAEEVDARFHKL